MKQNLCGTDCDGLEKPKLEWSSYGRASPCIFSCGDYHRGIRNGAGSVRCAPSYLDECGVICVLKLRWHTDGVCTFARAHARAYSLNIGLRSIHAVNHTGENISPCSKPLSMLHGSDIPTPPSFKYIMLTSHDTCCCGEYGMDSAPNVVLPSSSQPESSLCVR